MNTEASIAASIECLHPAKPSPHHSSEQSAPLNAICYLIPNLRPNPANRLPENPSAGRKRLDGGFAFRRNRFSGSLIGCNF
ncbi:hypothetical protein EIKCOROL_00892 [Eikenella corrodens ATCC 23834]|uniref:Uncharacterized protein n=1 Tax=Eikenella corrodens ATCC 23834 TaxID=546274 RepID=C0DU61_EIKCO|nr:hypothetical protein EIKCOROL_00892 [Eikenella corrodens ATCC 23834]